MHCLDKIQNYSKHFLTIAGLILAGVQMQGCGGGNSGTEVSVVGRGYLIHSNGSSGDREYSVEDTITVDSSGTLVDENGLFVLGFPANGTGSLAPISVSQSQAFTTVHIRSDGRVVATANTDSDTNLGQIALSDFANPEALSLLPNSNFVSNSDSGEPIIGLPNTGSFGSLREIQIDLGQ